MKIYWAIGCAVAGMVIVVAVHLAGVEKKIENLELGQAGQHRQINSFFKENSDKCHWLTLSKANFNKIGLPLITSSDGRTPEMTHLYACFNY